jgi:hypothetical protein
MMGKVQVTGGPFRVGRPHPSLGLFPVLTVPLKLHWQALVPTAYFLTPLSPGRAPILVAAKAYYCVLPPVSFPPLVRVWGGGGVRAVLP